MNLKTVHNSSAGIQLTTPNRAYDFMGYDSKDLFAYFAEVIEDNSIRPILRMNVGKHNPSRFTKTITSDLTGLRASLNVPYVTKSPPLYANEISVSIVDSIVLPTDFPDPSGW